MSRCYDLGSGGSAGQAATLKILAGDYRLPAGQPPPLSRLLAALLTLHPAGRPTAAAMVAELEAVASAGGCCDSIFPAPAAETPQAEARLEPQFAGGQQREDDAGGVEEEEWASFDDGTCGMHSEIHSGTHSGSGGHAAAGGAMAVLAAEDPCWAVGEAEWRGYSSYFGEVAHTGGGGTGVAGVSADTLAEVLRLSGLGPAVLAEIWDLTATAAAVGGGGGGGGMPAEIGLGRFGLAMHLACLARQLPAGNGDTAFRCPFAGFHRFSLRFCLQELACRAEGRCLTC